MSIQPETIKRAAHPHAPYYHLSDEDLCLQLDTSDKRSRAARKAQETMRQKRVAQQQRKGKIA